MEQHGNFLTRIIKFIIIKIKIVGKYKEGEKMLISLKNYKYVNFIV